MGMSVRLSVHLGVVKVVDGLSTQTVIAQFAHPSHLASLKIKISKTSVPNDDEACSIHR